MPTRRRFVQMAPAVLAASQHSRAETDPVLRKAMESARAAIPRAAADPLRPVYHFHPPCNWNNDPNGTIFYRGWHHLFYQFNPYGSQWGHMHWGHARSRDLVNWEHLPIAIGPSEDKGENHIFSGAAILAHDGRPRIIYTSIGNRDPEQWLAAPEDDDLLVWSKSPRNPILTTAAHGSLKIEDWRDPFMFREAGETYMVCGGNTSRQRWGGAGEVQLYRAASDDLTTWKHLGRVFQYRNREVVNVECPNLFKLDGKWVLIISPERPCEYFIGSLDLKRARFEPEVFGVLDAGAAYASNISVDDKGRTILWLWGRTKNPAASGWNGVMVLPRILSIGADGYLRQQPAPEFERLRGNPVTSTDTIRGDSLELEIELTPGQAGAAGLELRRSGAAEPVSVITLSSDGYLTAGSARTLIGKSDRHKLRVFVDKSVFEVYVNDGYAALYNSMNAGSGDLSVVPFAGGTGARILSVKAWPLQPVTFNLDRFRI